MKAIIAIIIIILVAGAGFWIWKINEDKTGDNSEITTSISAFNQTKNADATTVKASPRDVVVYTLVVENKSDEVVEGYVVETSIADITDLATMIDAQGGNYNSTNNSLVWTPLDAPANGSFDKKFTVRIKDTIPANSDGIMTARFNNEVAINVDKTAVAVQPTPAPAPTPTPTPQPTPSPYQAPSTGPSVLIIAVIALAFTTGLLMFRKARRLA